MPQPIGDLGPFTPRHCTVCGAPIPQVEDSNSGVRKWARHLNYMNHLKKYHLEYYKWSKRWTNSLYLPLLPFGKREKPVSSFGNCPGHRHTIHPIVSLPLEKCSRVSRSLEAFGKYL